ncbi:hypothetical protein [Streptomyces sp. RerS4]|uniref:hypothetical protein n=1 Tax=Streptomyces sp. RerS4 TaxID=2942449 RepID=UPI00201C9670|nr:hypothetical protein [Streptomyces sp. RerS4]UQX00583.1 hypothetical protein M4D82_08605 [Streptomyces sp. RerS4]
MTTRRDSSKGLTDSAGPTGPTYGTTTTASRPRALSAPRIGRGRRVLRAAAMAATLPYLALKAAWLAGSDLGIPAGSVLLEPGAFFVVANSVTLAMDACVILLVLVLTRPWGLRVPAPLLTFPVFVATGLLTPITVAFPAQLLVRALGMGAGEAARAAQEPFLDPWVYGVVYGGFIVQGLALAGLFVPYARQRWGGVWQGALGRRLPSPTGVVAGVAAVTGAVVGAIHLYWAFGGGAGLPAGRGAVYSAETGVVSATHALCVLGAAVGAVVLARGGRLPARRPLALTWICAAAALNWGAWLMLAVLAPDGGTGEQVTAAMFLTYAGQTITGLLASTVLIRSLRSRHTG